VCPDVPTKVIRIRTPIRWPTGTVWGSAIGIGTFVSVGIVVCALAGTSFGLWPMMATPPSGATSTSSLWSRPATASLGPWRNARSSAAPPIVIGSVRGRVVNCGSFPVLVAWPNVAASFRSGPRFPRAPSGSGPT